MIAIAVDDEEVMLKTLTKAISASTDIDEVIEFNACSEVIVWALDNTIDIAFLDINLGDMNGLALAEKILEARKKMCLLSQLD